MTDNSSHWITVATSCEFPLLSISKEKLNALQENEQNIKVNDVLEIARLDPGIAITLLRCAGTRQKKEITTLSHAILLISIPQTLAILSGLPVLERHTAKNIVSVVKKYYARLYLTAHLAQNWSILRQESETNELFTAGLDRDFFLLIPYLLEPEKALALDNISKNNIERTKLEQELFGASIDELSMKIARSWRLPELICESYSGKHHNPKVTGIRLASALVDWIYSNQSIHYPELMINQISEYIRIPINQTPTKINKVIIEVFRHAYKQLPTSDLIRILMSYPELINAPSKTIENKKNNLPEFIKQLRKQDDKKTTRELINIAVNAMKEGIGFSRVLFMAFDKHEDCLKGYSLAIEKPLSDLKHISISLELNVLFRQLLKKEQNLIINSKNQHKYSELLPGALRPLATQATIILGSIYINNKILGCFFVDHGKSKKQLSGNELQAYKLICKELKAAIESGLSNKYKIRNVA